MEGHTVKNSKSKYLVIDTAGFIRNAPLESFGQNLITLHEVIDEIRDKETKQRLKALPFELQFLEPDTDSISKVTAFSKKTGDYGALSATDLKVLALTYMLEVRHVGSEDHLAKVPTMSKTVEFYKPGSDIASDNAKVIAGFYHPGGVGDPEISENLEIVKSPENPEMDIDQDKDDSDEGIEDSASDEEDSDEGWITPSNFKVKKMEFLTGDANPDETETVLVACLTTDFAMQNVLKQIGLNVLSTEGILIKVTKTWILRCYACFTTTPHMDKQFCPKCGNKTLKRVSVTLNEDGSQEIHISTRRPLNTKGKKFSLPKQKGGKYAVNPFLTADQQIPQQKRTAMARASTNAMSADYTAGNAPFAKHDVTSRSALLGIGVEPTGHYWAHKNPNAVGRKTGNRKKKQV